MSYPTQYYNENDLNTIIERNEKDEKTKTRKRFEDLASKDLRSQMAKSTFWLTLIFGIISILILFVCVGFLAHIWTTESFKDLSELSQNYLYITLAGLVIVIIIISSMWFAYYFNLYPDLKFEDAFLTSYARLSTIKGSVDEVRSSLGEYLNQKLGREGFYGSSVAGINAVKTFGNMIADDKNLAAWQNARDRLPEDIRLNGTRQFHNLRKATGNFPEENYENPPEVRPVTGAGTYNNPSFEGNNQVRPENLGEKLDRLGERFDEDNSDSMGRQAELQRQRNESKQSQQIQDLIQYHQMNRNN